MKQEEKSRSLKSQPIVIYLDVQKPVRCLHYEFTLCGKVNNGLVLNKESSESGKNLFYFPYTL